MRTTGSHFRVGRSPSAPAEGQHTLADAPRSGRDGALRAESFDSSKGKRLICGTKERAKAQELRGACNRPIRARRLARDAVFRLNRRMEVRDGAMDGIELCGPLGGPDLSGAYGWGVGARADHDHFGCRVHDV